MIKRSFFALSRPRLTYDLLDPNPAAPEKVPAQTSLILLLPEAIDGAKIPLIQKGQSVQKGEKLKLYRTSTDYVICPAHGSVESMDSYTDTLGRPCTYLQIKLAPGGAATQEAVTFDPAEDLEFAKEYLCGLPGAPPFARIAQASGNVKTIVIQGADTDILASTCQYVCTTYAADLLEGATLLRQITGATRICMTLPQGIKTAADFGTLQILKTSATYPSALPAMVMNDHFGTPLPPGKTPEDIGVCFIKAEALVSLAKAFKSKAQVFEKIFSLVDKKGSRHRIQATIGTPLKDIFARFDIQIKDQDRIVVGGPMQGTATFTEYHPVTPDMDTVIVQDGKTVIEPSDTPCVNCGKCIRICPVNIPVNLLVRYLENNRYEEAAENFDLESCIECGLCAYVCTARIPIYQHIRLGKHELLALRAEA